MDWLIEGMQCKPQDDNLTDVVVTVFWRCNGEQDGFNGTAYGSCAVPAPSADFTPYSDLTQEQVLGWIWANGVDKDATEAAVQQQIDNQINPPIVQLPLPWAA